MATFDAARDALLADTLALEESRAATFLPGGDDDAALAAIAAQGEALMRALAVVEDAAPRVDDPDAAPEPAIARLEAKVDLLAALLAGMVAASGGGDTGRRLVWSAAGAAIDDAAAPLPSVGTPGRFRVVPSALLPTPLLVPATVEAVDGQRLLLRFSPPTPAFADGLERLVFRIHRREIARRKAPQSPVA